MGLFGNIGQALKYYATPDGLQAVGATLKDISAGGTENYQALAKTRETDALLRQKRAAQQQLLGLFGRQAPVAADAPSVESMVSGTMAGDPSAPTLSQVTARAPAPAAPSISDPNIQRQILLSGFAGADTRGAIDLLKASQPDIAIGPDGMPYSKNDPAVLTRRFANRSNVNGTIADLNDPANTNRYIPEAPVKGAMPVYDNLGRVTDWTMPQQAQGALEAASQAETLGRTRGTMLNIPRKDGGTAMLTGAQYLGDQGRTPGLGISQTPAEASAAKIASDARAGAAVSLPANLQSADQALAVISQLKTDPSLSMRTGALGVLPAIPGTKGADFDAKIDQLKGKLFLEAFATLKGGGQITEVEGKKATEAIGRLSTHQTPEGFKAALDDIASVIQAGKQRAATQAGKPAPTASTARPDRSAVEAELRRRGLIQ